MSTRLVKSSHRKKETRTFTYFIPSPPMRKSGYREKEFDKIMSGILQSGFELIELKTESSENGIFIIAILNAKTSKAGKLDENLDLHEKFKLMDKHTTSEIELEDEDV